MIHELKTRKDIFEGVIDGKLRFDVIEKARDFKVGDLLALNEMVEVESIWAYTGRCILCEILYILDDPEFCKYGYVAVSIIPVCCERQSITGNEFRRAFMIDNESARRV